MGKNILVFFDGTSNRFGPNLTNVVKLHSVCNIDLQKSIYIPGVGSISDKETFSSASRLLKKLSGLAFGWGLDRKVLAAYNFLMTNYEEGDCIFFFGFSRGAYTAKVLAGLIHTCGLLHKGNGYHAAYAYELYTRKQYDQGLTEKFKSRFSAYKPRIAFIGLWDSVSSVGNVYKMRNYPFTTRIANADIIRHALAIDERRALFKQNTTLLHDDNSAADIAEVWFAGNHGDVGGGNSEAESAYSKVALKWILDEAVAAGLKTIRSKVERYVISQDIANYEPLNNQGKIHSNKWLNGWGVLEILPRYNIIDYKTMKRKYYWPLFSKRKMKPTSHNKVQIHKSVEERIDEMGYSPNNLPEAYEVYPLFHAKNVKQKLP